MATDKKAGYEMVLKTLKYVDIVKEDGKTRWKEKDGEDPLSRMGKRDQKAKAVGVKRWRQTVFESTAEEREEENDAKLTFRERHIKNRLNWKNQKAEVLVKYTTNKDIPIHSKIVEDEIEKEGKTVTAADKAMARLAELESKSDEEKKDGMSYFQQSDLIDHLESLARDLEQSWSRGEKVKALRIVIQACKLLSVIKVPQCYPSLFVLTATVLDVFGNLVYERIYNNAVELLGVKTLPEDFKPGELPAESKEMCRNWFYKIASIRELIPRILVEMCMWKCNRFLESDKNFFTDSYLRFAKQIRGIGDPLLAIHARWYLCHKGYDLDLELQGTIEVEYAQVCLDDFFFCRPRFEQNDRLTKFITTAGITQTEYVALFSPVLRWLIELVAFKQQTREYLVSLLEKMKDNGGYAVVMQHLLGSFNGAHVCNELAQIVEFIETTEDETCSKGELWNALGAALTEHPPPSKADKANILNRAWESASSSTDISDFMKGAVVWVEYAVLHLDKKAVNTLLNDIKDKLSVNLGFQGQQKELKQLLTLIIYKWTNLDVVLSLDSFLPLLDMLEGQIKREFAFRMLTSFAESDGPSTKDDVVIGSLLDISRSLHDPLTSLSEQDEKNHIAALILGFMDKVDYGKDYEAQLNFYAECRRSFHKLQACITETVSSTQRLMTAIAQSHPIKSHTKKIAVLIKSCLTFCHITIPSIRDPVSRARCFLSSGYIAMSLGFLAQGEVLLHAAFDVINDFKGKEHEVTNQVKEVLPLVMENARLASCADKNGLWLINAVLDITLARTWDEYSSTKGMIIVECMQAVVPLYQHRVSLGEEDEVSVEFCDVVSRLTGEAMGELKRLSGILDNMNTAPTQHPILKSRIAQLAFSLYYTIGSNCVVYEKAASLLKKLWEVFVSSLSDAIAVSEDKVGADTKAHEMARLARLTVQHFSSSSDTQLVEAVRGMTI
eukprot:TRINITY_DN33406_c0_g1_i1.p1 TRINITY_DN33406_c0_g1~~TRINITY_DN33406_c0_g1_i1.p1  ORF type:complete len:951 (+),score=414.24 TRINITY_DN33406_c0_g1_i1:59-2911(+)